MKNNPNDLVTKSAALSRSEIEGFEELAQSFKKSLT